MTGLAGPLDELRLADPRASRGRRQRPPGPDSQAGPIDTTALASQGRPGASSAQACAPCRPARAEALLSPPSLELTSLRVPSALQETPRLSAQLVLVLVLNSALSKSQRAAQGWATQTLGHVWPSPEFAGAAHVTGADSGEVITLHPQGLDTALPLMKQNVRLRIIFM